MADTGEKYTEALRAVKADLDAARAKYGKTPTTSSTMDAGTVEHPAARRPLRPSDTQEAG